MQITSYTPDREVQITSYTPDREVQIAGYTPDREVQIAGYTPDREVQVAGYTPDREVRCVAGDTKQSCNECATLDPRLSVSYLSERREKRQQNMRQNREQKAWGSRLAHMTITQCSPDSHNAHMTITQCSHDYHTMLT